MRLCQWEEAIKWLSQVPASFYSEQGYAPYVAYRDYTIEPWIKRQWLKENIVYSDSKPNLKANPKLTFAKEMLTMESELNVLSGKASNSVTTTWPYAMPRPTLRVTAGG